MALSPATLLIVSVGACALTSADLDREPRPGIAQIGGGVMKVPRESPAHFDPEQIFVAIGQLRKEARDKSTGLSGFSTRPTTMSAASLRARRTTTRRKRLATSHHWASSNT